MRRSSVITAVLLAAVTILELGFAHDAWAVTRTWDGSSSTAWNTGANWSGSSVPSSTEDVVFNASASTNCSINTSPTVKSITISGYTGTISQDATARTLRTTGSFSQSSGTFSAPEITMVGGAFTNSGGTFTHNSKTVILDAASDVSHAFNNVTFYRVIFTDGLLAYYRGTGSTTQTDYTYHGYQLSPTAEATWDTGTVVPLAFDNTHVLKYDGTGDYHSLGSHPTSLQLTNWTIAAWIKTSDTDSSGSEIINLGNDFGFRVETDGNLRGFSRGTSPTTCITSGKNALDNAWHHAAFTFDGSNFKVYFDGEVTTCASTGSQTFDTSSGDDDVRLGAHVSNTSYDFNGYMDEVRIYDRALSSADVLGLALGGQPAGGTYTHTISSGFTTVQDVVLSSGNLAFGSSSLNVGGSWWNLGMVVTGTGTVTMSAVANGKQVRSNGQSFTALTFNGVGGVWSLADPLDATTVALSNGTLDVSGYRAAVTTTNQSGGTLTMAATDHLVATGGGTLGLTSTATNLHVESPIETDLVGYWKFDRFSASTTPDLSGSGNTATFYNGVRASTTIPTLSIANQTSIYLDGGSATLGDYASMGTTNVPASNAAQTVCFWTQYPAHASVMHMVSVRNTSMTKGYQIGLAADGTIRVLKSSNSAVLVSNGGAVTSNNTWYHLCYSYDGSSVHRLYVNGTTIYSSSANAADSATPNQILVGAYDTAQAQRYKGYIDELRIYDDKLTDTEIAALYAGRYPGRGGGATTTLSSNTAASTTLQVDNGTLATSSYALSLTATGTAGAVNAGGLTINSGSATYSGGLTVRGPGKLTMDTVGGTLNLADTKTLTIDGTLTTTTGTATTKPTIKSVSGTYTFTIGSATTATPTLNVNGLIVKNTTTAGMYINAAMGATATTVNQLDNVDFRSGASGGSHLKIYSQQGIYHFNNLTFDSDVASMTTTYAIHLTGNGGTTTSTETRVLAGNSTCKNTTSACEPTWERDDDATEDGAGDTTASDGAVVQWIYRDWGNATSTTGSTGAIEGFPSASFNWSSFAFWRTYVAYNNINSGTTNRLYVRDANGGPSGTTYYWDLPNSENFVGSPRWTTESGSHYVYAVSTAGRVYKLLDNGSTLATVATWPYKYGGDSSSSTATSPLTLDATAVYWSGLDDTGVKKLFRILYDKTPTTPVTAAATVSSVATLYGSLVFTAGDGTIFRHTTSLGSQNTFSIASAVISGRASLSASHLYFVENNGTLWALNHSATPMTEAWHYQDTSSMGHTCTNSSPCTAKNIYFDYATSRIYYGDKDGHVYSINSTTGAKITGYPIQPGASTDEIVAAPLYKNGLIIVGTTTGKVFVINAINASMSNNPTLYRTYVVGPGTSVSSVSWEGNTNTGGSPVGAYMVGTSDGRLIYLPAITDPG